MAHQGAGIEIVDYRDACAGQEGVSLGIRTPVACDSGKLANRQTFDIRADCLVILGAGAVIADLGIGENDYLASVRRIGEDFLIAGQRRIEDDFAGAFGGRTKTPALEDRSVLQGEKGSFQARLFLPESVGNLYFT